MTMHQKRAIERAKTDVVFARILASPDPIKSLDMQNRDEWFITTERFVTTAWITPALDARTGIFNAPSDYSSDPTEIEEIEKAQNLIRKFSEYADLLAGTNEKPFTDYLNGITVEDFRYQMAGKKGMEVAREIQRLYQNQILSDDLGGTQLYRYMKELGFSYIPTVNHLNEARRGEIPKGRYNMSKSRRRNEKFP